MQQIPSSYTAVWYLQAQTELRRFKVAFAGQNGKAIAPSMELLKRIKLVPLKGGEEA